jgi:preprotein translocase subunit SecF
VAVVDRQNEYIIRVRNFSAIGDSEKQRIEQAITDALPEGTTLERPIRVPTGGDSVRMDLSGALEPAQIQAALEGAGVSVVDVVQIGQGQDHIYEARLAGIAEEMLAGLTEELGADKAPQDPERVERVGPRAGAQLREAAVKSLAYALLFIMIYVAFRFDLRFAPGGVVALLHDAVITVGVFVILQKEFNLTIIAALLTIVGYSINDTIVVYDRIRENLGRMRDTSLYDVINISTSQTLSRTIVTSGTTLISISAFFIWGTDVIKDLAFALFIGITIGTYSSIYVAAPMTEIMDRRFRKAKGRAKKARVRQREEV